MMDPTIDTPSDLLRAAASSTGERTRAVAPWRLNLLRAGYGLLIVGLGSTIWPQIVDLSASTNLARGVVLCMLGALSALSLLGLRHPLAMLPLLFFELAWKGMWLARVALPLALADRLDASASATMFECLSSIVFVFVIPWSYVVDRYARTPANPWRRRTA